VVRENRGRVKEKAMKCPHCDSQKIIKNGKHHHQDGKAIPKNYLTQVATYSSKTKIKIKNAGFLYKKSVV
jgi:hypothetical protein